MEIKEFLEKQIAGIDPGAPSNTTDRLIMLSAMLAEWNKKFNLTAITDPLETAVKHHLDSLQLAKTNKCKDNLTIMDIGAGAGFPVIPLALLKPRIQFFAVESSAKKIFFMEHAVKELNLDNVRVINSRAEDLSAGSEYRERIDCVISRALAKFPVAMELCVPLAKQNGCVAYYASQKQKSEITVKKKVFEKLKCEIETIYDYSLPEGMGEHSIVIVKKLWKTDALYPRQFAKIKKNPL
jgi:16S rRNA (guanine527-N7)-methyltransferase